MYLIADRFTRLKPGTDFCGVDVAWGLAACRTWGVESEKRPQRGQFLPDLQPHSPAMGQKDGVLEERRSQKWTAAVDLQPTLPKSDRLLEMTELPDPVPTKWSGVHNPLLVANWEARVVQALRNPVQVEKHPSGHRHVGVLGDAIYDVSPDGTVQCFAWRYDEEAEAGAHLRAFPDNEIVAMGGPHAGLWMRGYAEGALQWMRKNHPPQLHDLCADYVQWLMKQMLAKHWTPDVAAAVRREVKVALALEPQVQKLAASMCRAQDPELVRMSEYNYCLRHRERVERLQQDAPDLALLHSLLYQDLALDREATQAMAAYLEQRGIGRGVWRLLHQEGTQWMRPFLDFYNILYGAGPSVACDLLLLVQMFGTQELIPFRILHALMAVGGNPNWKRKRPNYAQEFEDLQDLVARMGHFYLVADLPERIKISDNCDAIFNWAIDHWAQRPARSRRTIRLVGLLRLVSQNQKVKELDHRNKEPWNVPWVLETEAPQLEIHVLYSALDVWMESQAMRHCADKYINRCASGEYLMVSIRNARRDGAKINEHRRGVATMGFKRTDTGFVFHEISGFANRKVTPQHLAIAKESLRQLNEQFMHLVSRETVGADVDVGEAANDAADGCSAIGLQKKTA